MSYIFAFVYCSWGNSSGSCLRPFRMSPGQHLIKELRTSETQPPAPGGLGATQTAGLSASARGSNSEGGQQSCGIPSLHRGGSENRAEAGPSTERDLHRTKWLDGITDSMDMGLITVWEMVKDREASVLQSMGSQKVGHD